MDNKESELNYSYGDGDGNSYLQFEETEWFQGVHQITGVILNKRFMFNQTFEKSINDFFQTEPHQRYQARYQERYIFRHMFHNGPVLQFRLS